MKGLWVSRAAFDLKQQQLEFAERALADERKARTEERQLLSLELQRQTNRADAADARCAELIRESRQALGEAVGLSKLAGKVLFSVEDEGDVENPPTIGEADRERARTLREQPGGRR